MSLDEVVPLLMSDIIINNLISDAYVHWIFNFKYILLRMVVAPGLCPVEHHSKLGYFYLYPLVL